MQSWNQNEENHEVEMAENIRFRGMPKKVRHCWQIDVNEKIAIDFKSHHYLSTDS